MTAFEIRQAFLAYFAKHGHAVVPSSPLVPQHDPTLLFTNAGMVQFKEVFLGLVDTPYQRAVSIQKCLRAGGKHNDLENVGYTARHHTFFEMLGFFSFGDYFKREAIHYAWDFLTQVLKLPPEKLWVTVYEEDDESAEIWLKDIGVSADRFSRCGADDNFWAMGDTGPCGPCTEIFYDHGPSVPGGPPGSKAADGDRYIEIWNLVFMQFNRDKDGQLHPLPKKSVDTGMGLERLAAVLQGVHTNYEIDEFQSLIQGILKLAPSATKDMPSVKVIADHLRAMAFLILEGVMPSNEGRGYVLRRIMRRAIRHAHHLRIVSPFLSQLLPHLIGVMKASYPALATQQKAIEKVFRSEEQQFESTLENGLKLLKEALSTTKGKRLSGEIAFKLYDTYGFPLDLTEDILKEQGFTVDRAGFEACMQSQRTQSKAEAHFTAQTLPLSYEKHASCFEGYEETKIESPVIALGVDDKNVKTLKAGETGWVVLAKTPFYAESGGQVGDTGRLTQGKTCFEVTDTQRQGNAIIHYGQMKAGTLTEGMTVYADINHKKREAIRLNHTATHLLHAALKKVLGETLEQKGSLVESARARFDFSYDKPLTNEQLNEIERLVNAQIRANIEVKTTLMSLAEAKKSGALALFGEKYGETVRVLNIADFSKELCGGTHARRTGDIGYFKITASYGIANQVRRIEMMTGEAAVAFIEAQLSVLSQLSQDLKVQPAQLREKVLQGLQLQKAQEKTLAQLKQKLASGSGEALIEKVETLNGVSLLMSEVEAADMSLLRTLLDELRQKLNNAVIVLYTIIEERIQVVVGVHKDLLARLPSATELARILCDKAGGREDMAQGGGALPTDLKARLLMLKKAIQK